MSLFHSALLIQSSRNFISSTKEDMGVQQLRPFAFSISNNLLLCDTVGASLSLTARRCTEKSREGCTKSTLCVQDQLLQEFEHVRCTLTRDGIPAWTTIVALDTM